MVERGAHKSIKEVNKSTVNRGQKIAKRGELRGTITGSGEGRTDVAGGVEEWVWSCDTYMFDYDKQRESFKILVSIKSKKPIKVFIRCQQK